MPTYEFDMPDGTKRRAEGDTPEIAWENLVFTRPTDPGRGYPVATTKGARNAVRESLKDVARGYGQGVLDPIEGLIQLAERASGWTLAPKEIRDWARAYRKQAQSTAAGMTGEVLGNIFNPAYLIPGVAPARAATLGGRAIVGAAGGLSAPVEGAKTDADYWAAKGWQGLTGGLVGPIAPSLGGALARAEQVRPHWSPWHPFESIFASTAAPTVGKIGRKIEQIPTRGVGTAAGELFSDQSEEEAGDTHH